MLSVGFEHEVGAVSDWDPGTTVVDGVAVVVAGAGVDVGVGEGAVVGASDAGCGVCATAFDAKSATASAAVLRSALRTATIE